MSGETVTLSKADYEALLALHAAQVAERDAQVAARDTKLAAVEDENARLRAYCDQLKSIVFGRRSERHESGDDSPFQSHLFDSPNLTDDHAAREEEAEKRDRRRGRTRKPRFPEDAPRKIENIELTLEERACACCGELRESIGFEPSEKLQIVPASYVVMETRRHKYACTRCKGAGVETAPLPLTLFERSRVTDETRAQLIVDKFVDHIPLYRQSKILARLGVHYSDSSMSRQVIETADALAMLVVAMRSELMEGDYLQADETTIPVLKTERSKPGSHRGYLWAYADPRGTIVYDYAHGRSGRHPELFLSGFEGVLQTDRYSGYDAIRIRDEIIDVACWAHARRRFKEAESTDPRRTKRILDLVQELYAVERSARQREITNDERRLLRQKESVPVLDRVQAELRELELHRLSAPLSDAVQYTLQHWGALTRYVEHGAVEIDNNLIENSMRPVALGRKNFLFAGSETGAEAAAVLYSLTESCRRLALNPAEYLTGVMKELAKMDRHDPETWRALTPARWKAERTASMG